MSAPSGHSKYWPLWIGAGALIILPFAVQALGLALNTASMVVILAIAAMGLNLLVGYTGLTSFGHGVWFGVGAYAAGLLQKHWLHGQMAVPIILAMLFVTSAPTRRPSWGVSSMPPSGSALISMRCAGVSI